MWIMWKKRRKLSKSRKIEDGKKQKNPHCNRNKFNHNSVDKVDNLLSEDRFPDFYNISGAHSYQQIAVHTFF
jgi:hypothetical protein